MPICAYAYKDIGAYAYLTLNPCKCMYLLNQHLTRNSLAFSTKMNKPIKTKKIIHKTHDDIIFKQVFKNMIDTIFSLKKYV